MTWEAARKWLRTASLPTGPIVVARHRTISDPVLWRQAALETMASLEQRPTWRGLDPAAWQARRRVLLGDVAEVRRVVEGLR